jgi:hypothetical protein
MVEQPMTTEQLTRPLARLLRELVDGTPPTGGYVLNENDVGLLASLERLSAEEASEIIDGGSSIAAHVDHVTYGISLMNRWASGESPWGDADWQASWTRTTVSQEGWAARRLELERELSRWSDAIKEPRAMSARELTGMVSSVVHLAYHLGAIRQMDRRIRGPSANNDDDAFTEPAIRP